MKFDPKNTDTLFVTAGQLADPSALHEGMRLELQFLLRDATAALNGQPYHGSLPDWSQALRTIWAELALEGAVSGLPPLPEVVIDLESDGWRLLIFEWTSQRKAKATLELLAFSGNLLNCLHPLAVAGPAEEIASGSQGDGLDDTVTNEMRAIVLISSDPGLSVGQIAESLGVHRTTLYKWKSFMKAFRMVKTGENSLPSGQKDRQGNLEACRLKCVAGDN
jgi:hypothetical protein